jgi:hypothetical protein
MMKGMLSRVGLNELLGGFGCQLKSFSSPTPFVGLSAQPPLPATL